MKSPVVKDGSTTLLKRLPVELFIHEYKNVLNINVERFFEEVEYVELYKCNATGYRFYTPLNKIMGDSDFYEQIQNFHWYYMPWKWEHEVFLKKVNKDQKILEIGSGGLGFIEKLHNEGYDISGLELNKKSIELAVEKKLNVYNEFIEDYANLHSEEFDVVCSFQVLEHIANVRSFTNASIKALKKGGKLIVCIPNNDSFIKYDKSFLMNHPPHHAGLWNTEALKNLANYYPLKVINIYYEPLQEYHFEWYANIMVQNNILKHFPFGYRLLKKFYYNNAKGSQKNIIGHSIMVEYEKV